jgi:hypothetical protein
LLLITTSISSSINHMLEAGGTNAIDTASLQDQLDAVQVLATRRVADFKESDLHRSAIISISEMVSFADLLDPRPSDEVLRVSRAILEDLESLTSSDEFRDRAGARLNDLLEDHSIQLE